MLAHCDVDPILAHETDFCSHLLSPIHPPNAISHPQAAGVEEQMVFVIVLGVCSVTVVVKISAGQKMVGDDSSTMSVQPWQSTRL